MGSEQTISVVLEAFAAVEQRDAKRLLDVCHPAVEFHWPPSLPYGGSSRGAEARRGQPTWSEVWDPLQPTAEDRRMSPRVVAATDGEAVVLWRQRGVNSAGERFDGETLGMYEVRDGKLTRAQMFSFDTTALLRFLERSSA
jgi:ketosteroid isomerase-like protein